jgi:Cu(I)/Ag(I) efflux system membrane protein CusA/SilA
MWGGLVSLTLLTLFVVPAMYVVWRSFALRHAVKERPAPSVPTAAEPAEAT